MVAAAVLAASTSIAVDDDVPRWELDLVTWFNDVPDWVAGLMWPVMQIGTIAVGLAIAALVGGVTRDRLLTGSVAVAVAGSWLAVKVIKRLVDRDRPVSYLPRIDVRTDTGSDLGFLSGHSSMAAAIAVCVMPALPPRWRWVALAVAATVGISRMVYGVHLPLDVLGGWAFGVLVALTARAAAGWIARPAEVSADPHQKKIGPTSG
jgi:undecaprenyl-diphosphatase